MFLRVEQTHRRTFARSLITNCTTIQRMHACMHAGVDRGARHESMRPGCTRQCTVPGGNAEGKRRHSSTGGNQGHRSQWLDAWVFGAKTISVYAPSCLADEAEQARLSAEHDKARMARNLKSSEEALKRSQQDLSDLTALLSKERDQWEGLGAEQQKALEGLKADRDAAVESKRQLDTEVSTRLLLHHSNLASSKRTMS